mgnify:CR=1 FL=1
MRKACTEIIVKNYEDISKSTEGSFFLNDMPYEAFLDFISSDNLEVSDEIDIAKAVNRYINKRNDL